MVQETDRKTCVVGTQQYLCSAPYTLQSAESETCVLVHCSYICVQHHTHFSQLKVRLACWYIAVISVFSTIHIAVSWKWDLRVGTLQLYLCSAPYTFQSAESETCVLVHCSYICVQHHTHCSQLKVRLACWYIAVISVFSTIHISVSWKWDLRVGTLQLYLCSAPYTFQSAESETCVLVHCSYICVQHHTHCSQLKVRPAHWYIAISIQHHWWFKKLKVRHMQVKSAVCMCVCVCVCVCVCLCVCVCVCVCIGTLLQLYSVPHMVQ